MRAYLLSQLSAIVAVAASASLNDRPIIAVFAHSTKDPNATDYIAASYVKWIESAGGRAVPVPYQASTAEVDRLFAGTNGLLFPGGGAAMSDAALYFLKKALRANAAGDHFPVWGTCLGFEWLLQAVANDSAVLQKGFDTWNISLPLKLAPAAAQSRLFGPEGLGPQVVRILASKPVSMNNHHAGITPEAFAKNARLRRFFKILATSEDRKGPAFVAAIEALDPKQPIFGVQYHPEKSTFEFGTAPSGLPYEVIDHSPDAIRAAQEQAFFFVGQARMSTHRFPSPEAESEALIYNYRSTRTGPDFVETYYFNYPSLPSYDPKTV